MEYSSHQWRENSWTSTFYIESREDKDLKISQLPSSLSSSPAPTMSDLPSDLHLEILLRLPPDSLFRSRAVCKSWRLIIDDPSFIKSHTINHHLHSPSCPLLIRDSIFCRLHSLSFTSLSHQTADLTRIKNLVRRGIPSLRDLPTTSCNGLILISHFNFTKDWVIWNPLTRDCRRLSAPDIHVDIPFDGVGFGYDHASDDYKVVRIDELYRHGEFVYKTLVYSLKSGAWKPIEDRPVGPMLRRSLGVYLGGALYWTCESVIMVLDLETEEYRLLPPPPLSGEPVNMYLDALDGCLFVSCYYMGKSFERFEVDGRWLDAWIMEDEMSTWIKLLSFEEHGSVDVMNLRPVAYLKRKGEVILQHDGHFYWFDIKRNCMRKVTIHGLPECFSCQSFHGSLVRVVDDDDDGVKRKKKRVERSKLAVTVDKLCLRFKSVHW